MIKEIFVNSLEILTLLGGIFIAAIVIIIIYSKLTGRKIANNLFKFLNTNYLILGLIIALSATLGSLFYSEIMDYGPCVLCWYQRIFMYSQVALFAIAIYKRKNDIHIYSIPLSFIGALIALYQYILQLGILENNSCEIVGYSASCSETFFLSYGYITIPVMSLTAFILLIILGINHRRLKNEP